jgi:hypothetical protein
MILPSPDLVACLLDLCDCPRPTTQRDVGEVGVMDAVLDPHFVSYMEAWGV